MTGNYRHNDSDTMTDNCRHNERRYYDGLLWTRWQLAVDWVITSRANGQTTASEMETSTGSGEGQDLQQGGRAYSRGAGLTAGVGVAGLKGPLNTDFDRF